jgi:UDP-3-O-[3-hydroxymyristoyl] glucosamine N-acyltransferase
MYKQDYLQSCSFVGLNTVIGSGTIIGAFSIVRDGCTIGKNVRIGNYVHIGENVVIGDDCIISDYVCIGNNADGFFTDEKMSKEKGFGRIRLGQNVTIMNFCKIEPPLQSHEETKIDDNSHLGHNCYVKGGATVMKNVIIGAYGLIGEHSVIEGDNILGNRTTVGAYTVLREGCNAVNACLFENNKTYPSGWHASLQPALSAREYVRKYRNGRKSNG